MVAVLRGRGRFGHIVKCAHLVPASSEPQPQPHPRPSWAPDGLSCECATSPVVQECRVLLELPYTNPTPALATALRHTTTAERQNRAVVLRKVNILAAAQTDRHAGGASRMVGVIEQPVFGRGFLQLFHFTAGLERNSHVSRAGMPHAQSPGTRRGMGAGDSRAFPRSRAWSRRSAPAARLVGPRGQTAGRFGHTVKCSRATFPRSHAWLRT
jgi:hypothetical protein